MSLFSRVFGDLFVPLFTPLLSTDPQYLELMAGGFLTLEDGGKIELH